jgi:hypothetical protein
MAEKSWFSEFPEMDRADLVAMRKFLDGAYRDFSRSYGDIIETVFDPLLYLLVWFENLLLAAPWLVVLAALAALSYGVGRSRMLTAGITVAFLLIGYFGMWDNTMRTLSIITVATLLSIAIGIPIGIMMARSDRVQNTVTPVLDIMQTMPAFVYLIPVVMLPGSRDRLRRHAGAAVAQRAVAIGGADHHGGDQPDHHDGVGHGGHRLDDRRQGPGPAGAEIHHQSIFHHGAAQRPGDRHHRHYVRPRVAGLRQTQAETLAGRTR